MIIPASGASGLGRAGKPPPAGPDGMPHIANPGYHAGATGPDRAAKRRAPAQHFMPELPGAISAAGLPFPRQQWRQPLHVLWYRPYPGRL